MNAEERETKYVYNRADQLVKTLYPDGSQVTYAYDKTGRLVKREGASSSPLSQRGAGGDLTLDFTHFRYADGNLVFAENEDAKIDRKYDLLNRLIEEQTNISQGPTHQINYAYNQDLLARAAFAGKSVDYLYNDAGYLKTIQSEGDIVEFVYDKLGRRAQLTINGKLVKKYAYDEASRLTSLAYSLNQKPVFEQALQYNPVNNITNLAQNDGETRYDYDELDQLTLAKGPQETEKYFYDKAGNHLFNPNTPAQYSPTNAIVSNPAEEASYKHDKMGRMTHVEEPAKTMELAWNSRSQLKQATVDGKKVTYLYDPFGRRIGKIFEDGTKEYYGYDTEDIVTVYDAKNQLKHTFFHGPGIDEPLIAKDKNKKNIYVADYLGSVREVLGGDGKPVAGYDYEAFGKRRVLQEVKDKLISTAYAYTGREWDGETGWYYYRKRYFSFQGHRFISPDPLRLLTGDANLFRYVAGNPVNFLDPFGFRRIYLDVNRFKENPTTTISTLEIDGRSFGNILELSWWDNKKDLSRIPAGEYLLTFETSGKYGPNTLTVDDVPGGRSLIRIHPGNTYEDTKGCLLPGMYGGSKNLEISASRVVLQDIKDYLKYQIELDQANLEPTEMVIRIVDNFKKKW